VSSARNNRRSGIFGYRGRHAAPSQVEKIAGKATKAAPAVAIAGVIVGVPQLQGAASAATTTAATHVSSTTNWTAKTTAAVRANRTAQSKEQAAKPKARAAQSRPGRAATITLDAATTADRTYEVASGDTLSGIADRFYGSSGDWQWLYQQNSSMISNPNLIYPGQVLDVPSGAPSGASESSASDAPATSASTTASDDSASTGSASTASASTASASTGSSVSTDTSDTATSASASTGLSGTLSCSGLEQLWEDAGGSSSTAFMAAEIAMAESGGNQYAVSPTDDIGYWQINAPTWGAEASTDPITNAEAAISISGDGANWSPWTTYTTGAYEGQC
jgi:LysM repeat protein